MDPQSVNRQESQEGEVRTAPPIRQNDSGKKRRTILAVIILVSATVTVAVVLIGFFPAHVEPVCHQGSVGVVNLAITQEGANWSVLIQTFNPGHLPSRTYLQIRDTSGIFLLNRTQWSVLTAGDWTTYHAVYEDNNPGAPEVCSGDRLMISRAAYPISSTFAILGDGSTILALGTLE